MNPDHFACGVSLPKHSHVLVIDDTWATGRCPSAGPCATFPPTPTAGSWLGNLTLTGCDSEYSNRPFAEKKAIDGGFQESPLRLNKGLGIMATWKRLRRCGHCPYCRRRLSPGTGTSRGSGPLGGAYSLADHPGIAPGQPMQPLFEALRKELLALDPGVSEDFLKIYITYKANSYFVNVVPQSKRLVLNLNMPFSELRDPERRARDVTNVGHWGRGDVEVTLSSPEDLPYILGLVHQALERQLHIADDEQ
jgi:predicted transport protein